MALLIDIEEANLPPLMKNLTAAFDVGVEPLDFAGSAFMIDLLDDPVLVPVVGLLIVVVGRDHEIAAKVFPVVQMVHRVKFSG